MIKGFIKKLTVILLASTLTFTGPASSIIPAQAKTESAFEKYLSKNGLYYKSMPGLFKSGYKTAKKTYKNKNFSWYGMDWAECYAKYFYMSDHTAAWTGTLDILSKGNANKTYTVAKRLSKKAKNKRTRYEKAAAIHDALVKHCNYNFGRYKGQSAYEALVKKNAVCAGYSRAFKLMCDICNVPCYCVYGFAGSSTGGSGAHQWNIIKLDDGNWYEVDCTFDDPIGGMPNRNFFCLSSDKMSYGMTPQGIIYYHQRTGLDQITFELNAVVPQGNGTAYDIKTLQDLVVK